MSVLVVVISCGEPEEDFSFYEGDLGAASTNDAFVGHTDISYVTPVPKMDLALPKLDKSVPKLDQSLPKLDKGTKMDLALPKLDKSVPKLDQSLPKLDVPKLDKSIPKLDQFLPKLDTAPPKLDFWTCAGCVISKGVCVKAGTINPNNSCQWCDVTHPAGWSTKATGVSCDDKQNCTFSDICVNGACVGTSYGCPYPVGGCAMNSCTGKMVNGKGECNLKLVAINACLIDGACYNVGAKHPKSGCLQCSPSNDKYKWTVTGHASYYSVCGGMPGGSCYGGATCEFKYQGGPSGFCTCGCVPGMTPSPCGAGMTCKWNATTQSYFCL
jgi:hypothetical protein